MAEAQARLRIKAVWEGEEVRRGINSLNSSVSQLRGTLGTIAGLAGFGGLLYTVKSLVATSIQLNVQMERSVNAVAAIIFQFNKVVDAQGRVLQGAEKFNAALSISRGIMEDVRKIAERTILEYSELAEYIQTSLGYGMAKGLSPRQVLDVTSIVAQVARVMGLQPGYPVISELRAIFTGENLRASQVARAFQMGREQLGRLTGSEFYEYVMSRLQGMLAAQERFARSFEGRWTTLVSTWRDILRRVGEPLVEVLSEFSLKLNASLENWVRSGGVNRLKDFVRGILQTVMDVASWINKVAQWLHQNNLIQVLGAAVGGSALARVFGARAGPLAAGAAGASALVSAQREGIPWWERGLLSVGGGSLLGGMIGSFFPGIGTAAGAVAGGVAGASTWVAGELYRVIAPRIQGTTAPLSGGGGGGASGAGAGEGEVPPLTPMPRLVPNPLPPSADEVKRKEQARRRADQERAQAREISLNTELEGVRFRIRKALEGMRDKGYSEDAVGEVMQLLKRYAYLRRQIALLVPEGTSPELISARLKEAEQDVAVYTYDIRSQISEGRQRLQDEKRREEETRREAWRSLWESWSEEVARSLPPRAQAATTAEETLRKYAPLGPVGASVAAFLAWGRAMSPIVSEEERERERQRAEELSRAMRAQASALSVWNQYLEQAVRQYVQPPKGLPPRIREQVYGRRLAEVAGFLQFMAVSGMATPEVYDLIASLSQAYQKWEEDLRERQRAFWNWLAEQMEQSFHDAFIRMSRILLSGVKNWGRAFKEFASTVGEMIQRAILEAIYEKVIRVAVMKLIEWIVAQISRLFGGGGGGGEGSLGVEGVSVAGPSRFGKGLSYAAAGASVGGSIAGPVGAAVGAIVGFIGGLAGLQHGGAVLPRRAYLVGERGPEVFVPTTFGRIVPSQEAPPQRSAVNVFVTLPTGFDPSLARALGKDLSYTLRVGGW